MHQSVESYVLEQRNEHGWWGPLHILEVGSYNVNGTVRHHFEQEHYTGIDISEGPSVDRVMSSHRLKPVFGFDRFDLVLCLEMLEHDSQPWKTVEGIYKVLKPHGWVCATARGNGFGEHNNPDRWRFMREGFECLFEDRGFEIMDLRPDPQVQGWFITCRKPDLRLTQKLEIPDGAV